MIYIHFIWHTFYGQFQIANDLVRYVFVSQEYAFYPNAECAWTVSGVDVIRVPNWVFLITGAIWDLLIYRVAKRHFCKPRQANPVFDQE